MWLQADRPGVFHGQCAEYCGLQHAKMAMEVVAEPPDGLRPVAGAPARAGGRARRHRRAAAGAQRIRHRCLRAVPHRPWHAGGRPPADRTSPTWPAGGRSRQAPSPTAAATCSGWIENPQAFKPGTLMPAVPLDGRRARRPDHVPPVAPLASPSWPRPHRPFPRASLHERLLHIWETPPGLFGVLGTVDHKKIGMRYLVTAFTFLLLGGLEAAAMRAQLSAPGLHLLSPEAYNQLFSMHGITMIFLYASPILSGFSNYIWPLMLGLARHGVSPAQRAELLAVPVLAGCSSTRASWWGKRRTEAGSRTRRSPSRPIRPGSTWTSTRSGCSS